MFTSAATLLFIITFPSFTCVAYLPNSGNYDFNKYAPSSVDVYPSAELSDRLADKLFPHSYNVLIGNSYHLVQCN